MAKLNPYEIEYLFSYDVTIGAMYQMPDGPHGMRNIGYITGGKVWGDKINGEILPGGGDWCAIRHDGISQPNVHAMIRTDDGANIYMHYIGKMDTGENGYENYSHGIYPNTNYINTYVELESDHPDYKWVNRIACFGIGQVDRTAKPLYLQYDVYAFRSVPEKK